MTNWTKYRYNPIGAPSVCTIADEHGDLIAVLDGENWEIGTNEEIDERAKLICRAVNSHAALVEALAKVRQELWINYCLQSGTSEPNGNRFDSRPHIRIIDAALKLAKGA